MKQKKRGLWRVVSIDVCALIMGIVTATYAAADVPKEVQTSVEATGPSDVDVQNAQDWQVICTHGEHKPRCEMLQEQFDKRNHMKVVSLGITPRHTTSDFYGILTVPLGVDVARRVHLMNDGDNLIPPMTVAACLPTGCIIPIHFSQKALHDLKKAQSLGVTMISVSGRHLYVPLSLKGFSSALLTMENQSS